MCKLKRDGLKMQPLTNTSCILKKTEKVESEKLQFSRSHGNSIIFCSGYF